MTDVGYSSSSPSDGSSSGIGIYLDGLLEGHESRCFQLSYKFWMFCYLTLCLFGIIAPFATMKEPRFTIAGIVIAAAILGFAGFSLFLIKNYRVMNMDPVWRRAAYFVMLCTVLLAVANAILMHQSFEAFPVGCPETTTTTMAPATPTPAAPTTTMTTNVTAAALEEQRHHRAFAEYLARRKQERFNQQSDDEN